MEDRVWKADGVLVRHNETDLKTMSFIDDMFDAGEKFFNDVANTPVPTVTVRMPTVAYSAASPSVSSTLSFVLAFSGAVIMFV